MSKMSRLSPREAQNFKYLCYIPNFSKSTVFGLCWPIDFSNTNPEQGMKGGETKSRKYKNPMHFSGRKEFLITILWEGS